MFQTRDRNITTEAHSAADETCHWPKPRYSTSGKEIGELLS